jgi:hypothetical protein
MGSFHTNGHNLLSQSSLDFYSFLFSFEEELKEHLSIHLLEDSKEKSPGGKPPGLFFKDLYL